MQEICIYFLNFKNFFKILIKFSNFKTPTLSQVSSVDPSKLRQAPFLFAAGDKCCENLELSLENDALTLHGQRAGNYEIQADKFNGRNVWKRDDGQSVLWYNDNNTQIPGRAIVWREKKSKHNVHCKCFVCEPNPKATSSSFNR